MQLDRGLYAPFIVDDPAEPGGYDAEWVVVLDDWTDGVGPSPEQIFADLKARRIRGHGRDGHGRRWAAWGMGGMDGGDVTYPLYLVNGRAPADPDVLTAKPGQRVRLRIINAGADTIFTVALGGHDLTVTHTDGYPVRPVDHLGAAPRHGRAVRRGRHPRRRGVPLRGRARRQGRPGPRAGPHRRRSRARGRRPAGRARRRSP